MTIHNLGSVPWHTGQQGSAAYSPHRATNQRPNEIDTNDGLRGSVVELQAYLGEKSRDWQKAFDSWYAVPNQVDWAEVIRCSKDIKRIKAAISELTGEPIRKSLPLPWAKGV